MTKKEYLEELRKELEKNNVDEVGEIIAEYDDHFEYKKEEGLTEEEIAKKLSSPKEIAKEYGESVTKPVGKYEKGLKTVGVVAMSVPATLVYVLMLSAAVVLGAFSLVSLVCGFCLISTINIAGLIPTMPYISALFIGIACFGLAALSFVGTYYLFMYELCWGKAYIRWCKNITNNNHYPSVSKHPKISKKVSFKLKLVAIIGLVCFISMLVVGYISMCIVAGSVEPWHVWNWFN